MHTYIALLRGINVGGNNKIDTKQLKHAFIQADFSDALTYINSGNVIFSSDKDTTADALTHVPDWWGNDPDSKHNAIFVIPPTRQRTCVQRSAKLSRSMSSSSSGQRQ